MEDFAAFLAGKIKTALLTLWVIGELSDIPLKSIVGTPTSVLHSLSETATRLLEMPDKFAGRLGKVIVDICMLNAENLPNAVRMLEDALMDLTQSKATLTPQEKLQFIEEVAMGMLSRIAQKNDFEAGKTEMHMLERISRLAARIAFSGDVIRMTNVLDQIVRDFEHADEDQVLRSLYKDIADGNYLIREKGRT